MNNDDKSQMFLYYWNLLAPDTLPKPEAEYPFTKVIGRKHKFDWGWPGEKVAVEVNGNAWNTKGGGRHGQDADLEKMNLAVEMDWKVFQYSPVMLKNNPQKCIEQVVKTLQKVLDRTEKEGVSS